MEFLESYQRDAREYYASDEEDDNEIDVDELEDEDSDEDELDEGELEEDDED